MRIVSGEGIIVGRQKYTDTSLIVRWLSPTLGRISTIAKGALRPKSPFGGQLDLYYLCDFSVSKSRTGHLHTLREATLREPHLGLRQQWTTLLALEYFSDLITALTEEEHPLEADYDLLLKAIGYLNEKPANVELIERFERRLFHLHGLGNPGEEQEFEEWSQQHHFKMPQQRGKLIAEVMPLARRNT